MPLGKLYDVEVTCGACLEVFTDPVELECHHNLCLVCVTELAKRSDNNVVHCPECREPSSVFNVHGELTLKSNDHLCRVLDDLRSPTDGHTSEYCDNCEEVRATVQCGECAESLCDGCARQLHQKGKRAQHQVVPFGQLSFTRCIAHQKELEFFCEDCKVTVCTACLLVGNHKNHTYCTLTEAAQKARLEMTQLLPDIDNRKEQLITHIKHLTRMAGDLHEKTQLARREITTVFADLESQLAKRKLHLLSQLDDTFSSAQHVIQTQRKVVFETISSFNVVHVGLEANVASTKEVELLPKYIELVRQIDDATQNMESEKCKQLPNVSVPVLNLASATHVVQQIQALGEIHRAHMSDFGIASPPNSPPQTMQVNFHLKKSAGQR